MGFTESQVDADKIYGSKSTDPISVHNIGDELVSLNVPKVESDFISSGNVLASAKLLILTVKS